MSPGNMKKVAHAKKSGKTSPKKLIITISALVVVLTAGIALAVVYWPKKAPDPTKMTKENAVKYAASKDFAALPEKERIRYFESMRGSNDGNPREMFHNNNLTEAERQQLRENAGIMFRQRMEEQAKKLLAMTPAEREKEYDRMAEEIKKRMAERAARNPNGGQGGPGGPGQGGPRGGGGGNNVARMQQRFEGTSSDTRAIMGEMRKAMQKRLPQQSGPPRG